jgi:hypothetical protein
MAGDRGMRPRMPAATPGRRRGNRPAPTLSCSMISSFCNTGKARAKACREKAAESARAALSAPDPDIKASYQDLAMQWRELAAFLEELDSQAA